MASGGLLSTLPEDHRVAQSVKRAKEILNVAIQSAELLFALPTKKLQVSELCVNLEGLNHHPIANLIREIHKAESQLYGAAPTVEISEEGSNVTLEIHLNQLYLYLVDALQATTKTKGIADILTKRSEPTAAQSAVLGMLNRLIGCYVKRSFTDTTKLNAAITSRERTKTAEREIHLLSDELSRKKRQNERQMSELQSLVDNARKDYEYLLHNTNASKARIDASSTSTRAEAAATHEMSLSEMQATVSQLRAELIASRNSHREVLVGAEKRCDGAREALCECIAVYDTDMKAREVELEALREEVAYNDRVISSFESYFDKVTAERECVRLEAEAFAEYCTIQEAKKTMGFKVAAVRISRWYKRIKTARAKLQTATSKTKGGKGKAAKGKK